MAGPLGVLAVGLVAATTEVEDVDDEPPFGGAVGIFWQRPPPKLKASMAGLLGGAVGRSGSGHHPS
jgi:hypothetical protein